MGDQRTRATRTLIPFWHDGAADPEWLGMAEVAGVILSGSSLLDSAACAALGSKLRAAAPVDWPLLVTADPSSLWQSDGAELPSPAQIGDDYALAREAMEVTLAGLEMGRWLVEREIDAVLLPSLDRASGSASFGNSAEVATDAACAYLDGLQAAGVLACGSYSQAGDGNIEAAAVPLGTALARGLEWLQVSSVNWQRAATWVREELGFDGPLMSPILDEVLADGADAVEAWSELLEAGYDLVPVRSADLQARLMRRLSEEAPVVPAHSRMRVETLLADWLGE